MMSYDPQLAAVMRKIRESNPTTRHRFQPELQSVIAQRKRAGTRIPPEVHSLHNRLCTEAVEARFDNMPV